MSSDHLDDDALSATLDGEATPEEAAHVESCAACAGRVAELRQAANLIGAPVGPVGEAQREAAIAAALGAAPVSLAARRRRRTPPAWLAAAAVVLVALGLLPLLARDAGNDGDSTAADKAPVEELDDAAPEAAAGSDMLMSVPAAVEAGDLGAVTADELPERVRSLLASSARSAYDSAPATTTSAPTAPSCEPDLRTADASLGPLRLQARATFEGRPASVYVFDRPDDPSQLRVVVVAEGDCGTVLLAEDVPA